MPEHGTPTPGSGRLRRVWVIAALAALGCVQPAKIASFQVRQEIRFGPITVSVEGWEEVGQTHAPLSSLRTPDGEKAIAVFVKWRGLESYAEPDRQLFAEKFLGGNLALADSGGAEYEAIAAMTREIYRLSGPYTAAPRDWVVVFHAKTDSQGYTVRLHHPDPGGEAFDVAVVPLG